MRDPEAVIRLLAHKNTKFSIFHVSRAKSSAAYSKPLPRDSRGCVGMGLGRGVGVLGSQGLSSLV